MSNQIFVGNKGKGAYTDSQSSTEMTHFFCNCSLILYCCKFALYYAVHVPLLRVCKGCSVYGIWAHLFVCLWHIVLFIFLFMAYEDFFVLPASKTYIGSVFFGLRLMQAPNKPAGYHSGPGTCRDKTISCLDITSHFFRPSHLVPSFIMGFNSLILFFYVSKFTF